MSMHIDCTDVLVTVDDEHSAHARSRILLLSTRRPAQEGAAPGPAETPVPGVFYDRFSLTADGWKFAERRGSFWI